MAAKRDLWYCGECDPVLPLAIGNLPSPAKHMDPKTKGWHTGKSVSISDDEKQGLQEHVSEFITRMVEKYVTKKT
jgi:hypothetical protein